jgi:hypothetical protein
MGRGKPRPCASESTHTSTRRRAARDAKQEDYRLTPYALRSTPESKSWNDPRSDPAVDWSSASPNSGPGRLEVPEPPGEPGGEPPTEPPGEPGREPRGEPTGEWGGEPPGEPGTESPGESGREPPGESPGEPGGASGGEPGGEWGGAPRGAHPPVVPKSGDVAQNRRVRRRNGVISGILSSILRLRLAAVSISYDRGK